MLLTTNASLVTYPVLVIKVEGVKCQALIDTGEEVSSNGDIQSKHGELNVNATEFRPERTAAIIGSIKMNDIVANEIDGE